MENKFDLTKQECENILGHRIRNDTYLMIKKISLGESYSQVYDYIDKNRDELKIKKDTCLTSENTCQKYLNTLLRNKDKKNDKRQHSILFTIFLFVSCFKCSKKERKLYK